MLLDLDSVLGLESALLGKALMETLRMVSISLIVGLAVGFPLGSILFWFSAQGFSHQKKVYWPLQLIMNMVRSVPFIILMVVLVPFTRMILGTSIGTTAAMVPLSIGAIVMTARMVEEVLTNIPKSMVEVGHCIGASSFQIITKIMLKEAIPYLVQGVTTICLTLIAYSAMAGAIGGGGLGDLAIRYGYQRYDVSLMIVVVLLLIVLVQSIQALGDYAYKALKK